MILRAAHRSLTTGNDGLHNTRYNTKQHTHAVPQMLSCLQLNGVQWSHRFMFHIIMSEPILFSRLQTESLQQTELKVSRQQTFGSVLLHYNSVTCKTADALRKQRYTYTYTCV